MVLSFEALHLQNSSIPKIDGTVLGCFLLFQMMYKEIVLLLVNTK